LRRRGDKKKKERKLRVEKIENPVDLFVLLFFSLSKLTA